MRNFLLPTLWSILWVASLLLAQPAWTQTTAILGEPAASVSRGSSDPNIVTQGTIELDPPGLAVALADIYAG